MERRPLLQALSCVRLTRIAPKQPLGGARQAASTSGPLFLTTRSVYAAAVCGGEHLERQLVPGRGVTGEELCDSGIRALPGPGQEDRAAAHPSWTQPNGQCRHQLTEEHFWTPWVMG